MGLRIGFHRKFAIVIEEVGEVTDPVTQYNEGSHTALHQTLLHIGQVTMPQYDCVKIVLELSLRKGLHLIGNPIGWCGKTFLAYFRTHFGNLPEQRAGEHRLQTIE